MKSNRTSLTNEDMLLPLKLCSIHSIHDG